MLIDLQNYPAEGGFDELIDFDRQPWPAASPLGWGRDFAAVSPLRGVVLGAGTQNLTVAVNVQQI